MAGEPVRPLRVRSADERSVAVSGTALTAVSGAIVDGLSTDVDRAAAERRLAILGLAVVMIVGAVIRLWGLNAVGLNSDEAVYSGQAAALAHGSDAGLVDERLVAELGEVVLAE